MQLPLAKQTWDCIELLTEKVDHFRDQGFFTEELYRQLSAMARFVSAVRHELSPNIRHLLHSLTVGSSDKVLRDMAVNNFNSNLQILADLLYELYRKVVEIDIRDAGDGTPIYLQTNSSHIGEMLLDE
jgi:hypothetical protein